MPESDITERVKHLKKLCVGEFTKEFQRTLTDAEIDKARHDYVGQAVSLGNVEKNAKAASDSFKAEISAIKTIMEEGLQRIETGKRKVSDTLYNVPNYKIGMMEMYDKYGERIDIRKLTPDESTGQMFNNAGEAIKEDDLNDIKPVLEIGCDSNVQDADFEEVVNNDKSHETSSDVDSKKKSKRKTKAEKEAEKEAEEAAKKALIENEDEKAWPDDDDNDRHNEPPGE